MPRETRPATGIECCIYEVGAAMARAVDLLETEDATLQALNIAAYNLGCSLIQLSQATGKDADIILPHADDTLRRLNLRKQAKAREETPLVQYGQGRDE